MHFAVLLHLPTYDVSGLPDQKRSHSKRRGIRPIDWEDDSPRQRGEEMDQRIQAESALEQLPFILLLGIIDNGHSGHILVYRWHNRLVRERCYVDLQLQQPGVVRVG